MGLVRTPSIGKGLLGAVSAEHRGAVPIQCLGAAIRSPLKGADVLLLHNECILDHRNKASLFHRLAIATESDSHNETFPCLLWHELMASTLLDGGNSQAMVQLGCVCRPAHCVTSMTTSLSSNDRLRLKTPSLTGRRPKWSVRHMFLPVMTVEFEWLNVKLFWVPLSLKPGLEPVGTSLSNIWVLFHQLENSFPFFVHSS